MKPDRYYATDDLRDALRAPAPHDPYGPPIGLSFPMDSETAFRAQATASIGHTLSGVSLSNADWPEVYQYFKGLSDPDFAAEAAEHWTVKPRSVRAVQLTDDNMGRVRAWIETSGGEVVWSGFSADERKALAVITLAGEQTARSGDYIVYRGRRDDWTVRTKDEFLADHDHQQKGR